MELYAIIGFVALVLITAAWAAMKAARSAAKVERETARGDAYEAQAKRLEAIRLLEQEMQGNASWQDFHPTKNDNRVGSRKQTRQMKSGAGLLLLVCLPLVISTGCARTVYVESPLPVIPVGPDLPVASDEWDCRTWEDYARRLRAAVDRYHKGIQ